MKLSSIAAAVESAADTYALYSIGWTGSSVVATLGLQDLDGRFHQVDMAFSDIELHSHDDWRELVKARTREAVARLDEHLNQAA